MSTTKAAQLEPQALAPYAVTETQSRGRVYAEAYPAFRTQFQRDRDRIIHCSAFRRLEYKTQVFVNHEGDMFRTRLTHSLEVAQIARTVARALSLNEDLTETIALAHDLGHTPFGHAGQSALNACMKPYGGFEHNRQSLRVVEQLEERYLEFRGLNLLYESREGILKHCSIEEARSLGELGQRFLDGTQPSLEAQIANISDEIAYNHHDIDDGLRANLLSRDELFNFSLFREMYESVAKNYPSKSPKLIFPSVIRKMLNYFVVDLVRSTRKNLANNPPRDLNELRTRRSDIAGFSALAYSQHLSLKRLLRQQLYQHDSVLENARRAAEVVTDLFETFFEDPANLPTERIDESIENDARRAQIIADYVAGMTDRFAIAEHQRLFDHARFVTR